MAEIPEELEEAVEQKRQELVEKFELDDELLEAFLEEQEISTQRLRQVFERQPSKVDCWAVLCGSSFKNKGVQPLLDAVVAYLPPLMMCRQLLEQPDSEREETRTTSDSSCGLISKSPVTHLLVR